MNLRRSSIGLHSFQGIFALPQKARLCNPCVRNELSPLSQEGQLAGPCMDDRVAIDILDTSLDAAP
jgi:hypothetical protein